MAVSYARGVLVSKILTLPQGVHDGFLPVNKKKHLCFSTKVARAMWGVAALREGDRLDARVNASVVAGACGPDSRV
jgi:hypothetical protein